MKKIKKATGVVVPLASLRTKSSQVIGEFPSLSSLAQFCKKASLSIIQLLPLNDTGTQSSPYSALSSLALHPLYISISAISEFDSLYDENESFIKKYESFIKKFSNHSRFDYNGVHETKLELLQMIFDLRVSKNKKSIETIFEFAKKNSWVCEYAVYKHLKKTYLQASWKTWKKTDRVMSAEKINKVWQDKAKQKDHLFYAWLQMIAHEQFLEARKKIASLGILLKGDIPILMNEDSCDCWAHPDLFNQKLRAGSPPDGDNPAGQSWGFPIYNWDVMKAEKFSWWKNRLQNASLYYDAYRLDHILGFFRLWAIAERDANAMLGYTLPNVPIKRKELSELGFDEARITWLSEPHVRTGLVEDVTWNHDAATKILSTCMTKLQNEELWIFARTIFGSSDILHLQFGNLCTKDAAERIKEKLSEKWCDRALISLSKNEFVFSWNYKNTTSWASLSTSEKEKLETLFQKNSDANEKLWEKCATEIFQNVISETKMIPCGEDLGAHLNCLHPVMEKFSIFSLLVLRWAREWEKEKQPFVKLENYPDLSVATTSVHDSSTMREWFENENESALTFLFDENFLDKNSSNDNFSNEKNSQVKNETEKFSNEKNFNKKFETKKFSSVIAKAIFEKAASAKSLWFINPLQDYLYLNDEYYLENARDERINIPGTVSDFNWTYRIPIPIEKLQKDVTLIKTISEIVKKHDGSLE